MSFTIQPKHPRVRKDLYKDFMNEDLEVMFISESGDGVSCSRLVLAYHSKYFSDKLVMGVLYDEAKESVIEFDCPFSYECIDGFVHYLHGITVENLPVATMVELMKFVKFYSCGEDEVSTTLLNDICRMLIEANLSIETKLMICLVSNKIKDFEPGFDKQFFGTCSYDELKLKCFDIDLTTDENEQLKELLKVVDKREPVILDDYAIQSMIFDMVKGMEHVTKSAIMHKPTTSYDETMKAAIVNSKMSDEMEKYAVTTAHDIVAQYSSGNTFAKNLETKFGDKYGSAWHCVIGDLWFNINHDPGKYIQFKLDKQVRLLILRFVIETLRIRKKQ